MATKYIKPTESELEILKILWNKESATVREVHAELSKTKESGYTTTLKLMQIMFEKGLVKRDDSNKTHIYEPAISKQRTQKQFLDKAATVKLAVTDVFFTAPWNATSNFGGLYIRGGGAWESQTFRVSFSYRFGSAQIKSARERRAGSEAEARRIKGGGS